ncbi:MAG: hypothetical protein ACT452_12805 [Microthrixaceae bacterium]
MGRWHTDRLEFCLDRWEREESPDHTTRVVVYNWLIDLLTEPRPPSAAPVTGATHELLLAEVPGTTVVVLYGLVEDQRRIIFFTIDTL